MMPEMVSAQWDYEENPIADTSIFEGFPNNNYGQATTISVGWDGTSSRTRCLLQFDLSSLPLGAIITDARLSLSVTSVGGSLGTQRTFTVYRVSKSWIEGDGPSGTGTTGATWINTDKSGPTPWNTQGGDVVLEGASSKELTIGFALKEFDVTDIVTAWITDGQLNYGFLIKVDNEAGDQASFGFRSRESSTTPQPILQINWTIPPEDTVPVGGLTIPVNNFRILTPYIALAGLIIAVSAVIIKKRK